MEQKRVERHVAKEETTEEEIEVSEVGQEAAEKIDALLDEIDLVLEENAEEFVKNFVQHGGE